MIIPIPPNEKAFRNHVLMQLKSFSKKIDISRYVTKNNWTMQKVSDLYYGLLWDSPEIFYISKSSFECFCLPGLERSSEPVATSIIPKYTFSKEQYPMRKSQLDTEVQKVLATIDAKDSAIIKALKVHDYLALSCEYNFRALEIKDSSPARSVWGALKLHKVVCEGFAMAYLYLLKIVGIPCKIILNTAPHCWNYVFLNDCWYHVDVTFDSPCYIKFLSEEQAKNAGSIYKTQTSARIYKVIKDKSLHRENFLMSDQQAKKTGHDNWNTQGLPPALDTRYDNMTWPVY